MGYAMSGYASGQAAIESDYSLYLKGIGGRVNVRATGPGSTDKVYLDSNNGVSIETNATVTGILTASNVSTAGSVTAATLFGDGSNLTGVGGGSTAFVNAATLNVSGVSTFAGVTTFSSPVTLTDNTALNIGAAPQNLRITHTGTNNKIQTYQGGTIEIGGSADDGTNYEYGFRYTLDNQVELTFNGTKKF